MRDFQIFALYRMIFNIFNNDLLIFVPSITRKPQGYSLGKAILLFYENWT
eukprot:UN08172